MRPAIPSELRRRILVEAGHRCAIHTCRHPDVDVHHIVPWETCRDHAYENLIALCPNCHRRAGTGEIDRKSLRLYKAKLSAGATDTYSASIRTSDGNSAGDGWQQIKITDEESAANAAESFELEIPDFRSSELSELNLAEHGWATGQLLRFRGANHLAVASGMPGPAGYVSGSFQVTLFTSKIVSLRYAVDQYYRGAVHPNVWFRTVNVYRNPVFLFDLHDVFLEGSRFLEVISEIAIDQLLREGLMEDCVRRGASADQSNFSLFNFTESGLVITFPTYAIGCYADGPQFVTVPWQRLAGLLNPALF